MDCRCAPCAASRLDLTLTYRFPIVGDLTVSSKWNVSKSK
ncbi:hypothetical protein HMPREF3214_00337 [Alloscardovia omnicolens]|nr:hypothetical protein HMPREF3214_00337 [Alloscardovia omnicolens]